jgi:hypothetical protein
MKYSIITPRTAPVVCDSVIRAREDVARAMRTGSVRDIDAAYARLEQADRVAKMRRASAHALRRVTAILGSPDPAWDRFLGAVEGFRR